ncbi:MAG: hypothetical protein OXN97_04410 [Bryobacterales bacterium]|nr:hypothetical protein [Bryobacterales bacterium]MDE0625867.1 hypothetical protein [Bryobacterales bacterium]
MTREAKEGLAILVGTAAFSYLRDATIADEERFLRNQREAAEKYRERRPEPRMTATQAETPQFEFVRFEWLLRLPFPDWTAEDRAYAKSLAAAKPSAESNWPPAWRNLSWKLSAK